MRYVALALVLLLTTSACSGNPPIIPAAAPGGTVRTRAELEQLVRDYESSLNSPAYSSAEKERMRAEMDQIRSRLRDGDFRVGDRILLDVQGEPDLPDTVTVQPGQTVQLPLFGEISVAGVLRSEITSHMTEALSSYIRDPVVRANGLMRVSVLGAVGNPGFYTMPAETVLGEAIMVAGGPSSNANLDQVRIRRGAREIMDGGAVREALQQGLTLDQLNLQAGDQVEVPQRRGFVQVLGIVTGVMGSLGFIIWRILQ